MQNKREYMRQWREKNRQKINEYERKRYAKNKDKKLAQQRKRYQNNKKKEAERKRKYYLKNRENILKATQKYKNENRHKVRESGRKYYQKNKSAYKEYARKNRGKINAHEKQRKKIDLNFRIKKNLRSRLYQALKRSKKSKSTMQLIGCSIEFLRKYLRKKFKKGMSWKNYGKFGWTVDHIIPCDVFDLTNEKEQEKCFHYTNLQPLWATENSQKSNKLL